MGMRAASWCRKGGYAIQNSTSQTFLPVAHVTHFSTILVARSIPCYNAWAGALFFLVRQRNDKGQDMRVKDLDNRRAALVWFGIIIILTATQTAAIIISGSNATDQGDIAFVILGYLLLLVLLIVPLGLLGLDGALRGAAAGDNLRAPLALGRPNPAGALAPGESLTLVRTMTGGSLARLLTLYAVLFALLAAVPTFFLWLVSEPLAMVLLLGAVWLAILATFFGRAVRVVLVSRKMTLVADDRGIMVYRRRFIAWEDIRAVVRVSGTQGSPSGGAYFLLGQTNSLGFGLQGTDINRNLPTRFTYAGGAEAYTAQAQRLLATIMARSQAPLRVQAAGYYGRVPNRTYPLLGVNATDVQALPPAHPAFQPSLAGIQVAPLQTQPVTLRAQGSLMSPATILFSILGALVLFVVLLQSFIIISDPNLAATGASQGVFLVSTIVPPLVILTLLIPLLLVRSRQHQRAVTVDALGITGSPMMAGLSPVHIPWPSVRAWVVLPPSLRINAATYAIYSDGPTIVWQEPLDARLAGPVPGDRTAAFRMQADILRAIIATRSGQILRMAQPRR
jgi:hypothetical protein